MSDTESSQNRDTDLILEIKMVEETILKLTNEYQRASDQEKADKARELLLEEVLPLLNHVIKVKPSREQPGFNQQILICSLSEFALMLITYVDGHQLESFYDQIFELLLDKDSTDNISAGIIFLHNLFSSVVIDCKYILPKLFQLLKHFNITSCYQVSSLLIPYIAVDQVTSQSVWEFIVSVWLKECTVESQCLDLVLTLICCLVHVFIHPNFPLVSRPLATDIERSQDPVIYDVRSLTVFWDIVQSGLIESNPLSRKRSLFLLDRVLKSISTEDVIRTEDRVFWWGCHGNNATSEWPESEAIKIWDDIILLIETLEEKQVHIISPILPRLKKLFVATKTIYEDHYLLHITWLIIILRKIFNHDSKSIIKKGVKELLEMDLTGSPFLLEKNWKIFLNLLLEVFSHTSIFARENHSNYASLCPPLVNDLILFIQNFISELDTSNERGRFITEFLSLCSLKKLPDIPMVYIAYSLTQLASEPLIGSSGLLAIRSLVSSCLLTHKLTQRSATQCFLLSIFCKFVDPICINYFEMFQTFGCFRGNESLIYGSQSWNEACQLVSNKAAAISSDISLLKFLQNCIESVTRGGSYDTTGLIPESVAIATLLSIDSHISSDGKNILLNDSGGSQTVGEVVSLILSPVFESIAGAQTRVYMSLDEVLKSVKFLNSLLQQILLGHKTLKINVMQGIGGIVHECLLPWIPDIISYFHEALLNGLHISLLPQIDIVQLYSDTMRNLFQFIKLNGSRGGWSLGAAGLAQRAAVTLLDHVTRNTVVTLTCTLMGSVSVLEWVCDSQRYEHESLNLLTESEHNQILNKLSQLPVNINVTKPQDSTSSECGPSINYCLLLYWSCFEHVLHHRHVISMPRSHDDHVTFGSLNFMAIAELCVDHFDVLVNNLATPLSCLASIVTPIISMEGGVSYLVSIIEKAWPLVLELKEHLKPFVRGLTSYLQLLYHIGLISMADTDIIQLQIKYSNEIFAVAEVKGGICNVLVDRLHGVYMKLYHTDPSLAVSSLKERIQVIVHLCSFGPIFRKNLRVIHDVDCFIKSLKDNCSSNELNINDSDDDLIVRVTIVTFLCQLASRGDEYSIEFLSNFIDQVIDKLNYLYSIKPRYYINSYSHRYRLRLLQTLLLLHQWIDRSLAIKVVNVILGCLECDNQLSVRYLMEWLVTMLIQRHSSLWRQLLLPQLEINSDNSNRRLSRFCSVFTIAMQLGRCFITTEEQVPYYAEVLPLVFQWTMCHHFVARLYAAGATLLLWKQWNQCNTDSSVKKLEFISTLEQFIPFIEKYSDIAKSKKLEHNIFFSLFHPMKDFNIECIFHIIPALTNVIEEEWIPLHLFQSIQFWLDQNFIHLKCTNDKILESFENLKQSQQDIESDNNITLFEPSLLNNNTMSEDVQKKITPWSNSSAALLQELFPTHPLVAQAHNESGHHGNLILVASLVHKQPNLGGLCRTSEIFGVQELVLANGAVLEEKEFKSLSVTAEKWLKITQVKPAHLKEYLIELKKRGYTLVGVEQTAHSKSIADYHFPRDTALLLGVGLLSYMIVLSFTNDLTYATDKLMQSSLNEREGIPVDLIHALDDCIEIPQYGVIRSLNVHVSGALAIWEYTRQHLVTN